MAIVQVSSFGIFLSTFSWELSALEQRKNIFADKHAKRVRRKLSGRKFPERK